MTYDVFLSYSRRDAALVKLLANRLTHEAGLHLWLDFARLQPGSSWRAEIETAMNDSTAVLIVWGSSRLGPIQRQERDLAYVIRDACPDFRVIYVLLPGTSPPQGTWANVDTWIHFESSLDESDVFAQVVAALKGEAPPPIWWPNCLTIPPPTAAWLPLAWKTPVSSSSARLMWRTCWSGCPIIHFWQSWDLRGAGKYPSSRRGFSPACKPKSFLAVLYGPGCWSAPAPTPCVSWPLLSSSSAQSNPLTASDALLQRLQAKPDQLPEIIQLLLPPQGRLVLVIDRLEELLTLCQSEEERRSFLDALLAPIHHPQSPRLGYRDHAG